MDLRFTDDLPGGEEVEIVPGGKNILVTNQNKMEYLNLLMRFRFEISVAPFVDSIVLGMREVLTPRKMDELIHSLSIEQFSIILAGRDTIDIEECIQFAFMSKSFKRLIFSLFLDSSAFYTPTTRVIL